MPVDMDGFLHSCCHILLKRVAYLVLISFLGPSNFSHLISWSRHCLRLCIWCFHSFVHSCLKLFVFSLIFRSNISPLLYVGLYVKLSGRILLLLCWMSAGGMSAKVDISLGFCTNASWNGEKPCSFSSEFLSSRQHVNVKSMSRCCDSSNILSIMSDMMRLCRSTSPLLNGD